MTTKNISNKTIGYIESNIEYRINLESVANLMNYSKFHFHRLFLSEMGISVTDYIRLRRIFSSSHALENTELSVTAISMKYGFNNVDTFIRNFKSYYGITPSKYRSLNIKSRGIPAKECANQMKQNYESIRNCSKDDKQSAFEILDRMVELSNIAHNKGLLSLENELSNNDLLFLKKAMELLLKGTEYHRLENILTNYINSSNLNDYELLVRVLILEGILLLHEGAYPWDVRSTLSSYFGEDFIGEFDKRYYQEETLGSIIEKEPLQTEDLRLVKEIARMNERQLQRVYRECDIIIIAISLIGLKKSDKEMVVNCLPLGQKRILSEVVESIGSINAKHIKDANNEIINVIQKLRLSKDI